jgi:hypothetical protein
MPKSCRAAPMRAYVAALALALPVLGCGCTAATPSDTTSADEAEAEASEVQSSHFAYISVAAIDSQSPQAAASAIAAAPRTGAFACVTRAADPSNPLAVDLKYSGCAGPFGLTQLSGTVVVTFSENPDGTLHAVHQGGEDLAVDGVPVTFSATADITVSGSTRNVHWAGTWLRPNARGELVTHKSDVTIVVDVASACRDTSGTAVTTVDARETDSTIDGYRVCLGGDGVEQCPLGTILHVHEDSGRRVQVTFDGTDVATVKGPAASTQVQLACGG